MALASERATLGRTTKYLASVSVQYTSTSKRAEAQARLRVKTIWSWLTNWNSNLSDTALERGDFPCLEKCARIDMQA